MRNNWRKYNDALIPILPPHLSVLEKEKEILRLLSKSKTYFARYITNFDSSKETLFWYVINDNPIDIIDYDIKTRNQIRKGLKMCNIRKITREEFVKYGYEVYHKAFQKYKTFNKIISKDIFQNQIIKLDNNCDIWGVFNLQGELIGYSQNNVRGNVCEFSSTKFHPNYLKSRPSEALFYTMCNYYLNEKRFKYIHNGTRSIAHHTNIQEFLIKKFKFRKAFCYLHVVYSPKIKILINIFYPFRNIIQKVNLNLFQKVGIVLKQEEIVREQLNE